MDRLDRLRDMVTVELVHREWLLLLLALPAWLWWIRPHARWGVLVARGEEVASVAMGRGARVLEAAPKLLRAAAAACVIVALARPQLVRTYREPVDQGVGIVFAIDLSTSMWAVDMAEQTTRLQAAKATVQRFLTVRADDQVGLVSFAGEALVRLPLTHDLYVVQRAVEALEVGLLLDGTDIAGAIAVGAGLLKDAPQRTKILVLVTDGAHNKAGLVPALAARAAAAVAVRIYPIAIGADAALSSNSAGMETVLTRAAAITGGRYFRATDIESLDEIYREIDRLAVPTEVLVEQAETYLLVHGFLLSSLALLVLGMGLRGSPWGVLP